MTELADSGSGGWPILMRAHRPVEGEETIETVLAPPSASRLLGTDSSTPMLLLTRSIRDATGQPLEYVRSLYRGDRFRFTANLKRP